MLKVKDGRGEFRAKQAVKNRKMVHDYFIENPNSTQVACAKAIGVCVHTVRAHVKVLNADVN